MDDPRWSRPPTCDGACSTCGPRAAHCFHTAVAGWVGGMGDLWCGMGKELRALRIGAG